ncbi:MAG: hypothetical protein HFJ31_01220 [Clostridia bacterium]|nr:hypothetical protein [Clostridia bacterium]
MGRYTFNTTNGTPTKQQDADNYTEVVTIGSYFQELISNSGNTAAKNLGDFVTKTKANGGYYLGRYETSQGIDGKVKSQYDKVPWTNITQLNAATKAREMYNSDYIESDLINSYSWDTAIVFIQKYSGNSNYANKTSANTGRLNTGRTGDKVCNVHDMSSNFYEWSTERSMSHFGPCVVRGGSYDNDYSDRTTSFRNLGHLTTGIETLVSFRSLLYIK